MAGSRHDDRRPQSGHPATLSPGFLVRALGWKPATLEKLEIEKRRARSRVSVARERIPASAPDLGFYGRFCTTATPVEAAM